MDLFDFSLKTEFYSFYFAIKKPHSQIFLAAKKWRCFFCEILLIFSGTRDDSPVKAYEPEQPKLPIFV